MKTHFASFAALLAFSFVLLAEAPKPIDDFRKTLSAAQKGQKMGFILLGRANCGNCNATKRMIGDGKIPVTAGEFVLGDLNIDDPKTEAAFMRKYGRVKFGETLPFVVVTDSKGKVLASSGGAKSAAGWTALIAGAKAKMAPASAPAAGGADPNWPFKSAPKSR